MTVMTATQLLKGGDIRSAGPHSMLLSVCQESRARTLRVQQSYDKASKIYFNPKIDDIWISNASKHLRDAGDCSNVIWGDLNRAFPIKRLALPWPTAILKVETLSTSMLTALQNFLRCLNLKGVEDIYFVKRSKKAAALPNVIFQSPQKFPRKLRHRSGWEDATEYWENFGHALAKDVTENVVAAQKHWQLLEKGCGTHKDWYYRANIYSDDSVHPDENGVYRLTPRGGETRLLSDPTEWKAPRFRVVEAHNLKA